MNKTPTTTKTRKDKGLSGRLDQAFWRKHHVATMTADEEQWRPREPGGNLGRVFVIILLFHVVLIGAVVAYNIISPRSTPVAKSESGSTVASRIPPKVVDEPASAPVGSLAATPPASGAPRDSAATTVAPAAEKATGKAEETDTYEVRSGDNLPAIAAALAVSPEVLIKLNDLENSELYPGRKILYPKGEVPRATPMPSQQFHPFPIQENQADKVARDEARKEKEKPAKQALVTLPEHSTESKVSDTPPAKPSKPVSHVDEHPPAPKPSAKNDKDSAPPKPKPEKKTEESKPENKTAKNSAKTEKSSSGKRSHIVTSKETLYSIARKYGIKVEALQKANGIKDANVLRDGMKLVIPSKN